MQDKKELIDKTKFIDFSQVVENFEDDWSMFQFSLDIFNQSYPDPIKTIDEVFERNDSEEIHRTMHSLKGVFKQIGARSLSESFGNFEAMAEEGKIDEVKKGCMEIKPDIEELLKDIASIKE